MDKTGQPAEKDGRVNIGPSRPQTPDGHDLNRWRRVSQLFDQVCGLPPEQWSSALNALSRDAADIAGTLDLLQVRTLEFGRLKQSMDHLLPESATDALLGRELGPWRLERVLGEGGMGVVYLAVRADQLYTRQVALKLLHPRYQHLLHSHPGREREILGRLEIPGIARLYDAGVADHGQAYMVMEYVEGIPLDAYATALPLPDRVRLMAAICRIVHAAHNQLIVHCDLKPGNILINAAGKPVLLDFGIARLIDLLDVDGAVGPAFASPTYASPELLHGDIVGVASDVFSLGVLLAQVLSRQRPPMPMSDPAAAMPSLWPGLAPKLRRQLRGDLDAIVTRACAPAPGMRYSSAEALANDLERYLQHRPVRARSGARLHLVSLSLRRHWRSLLPISVAMVVCGLLLIRLILTQREAIANAAITNQVSEVLISSFQAADPENRHDDKRMLSARDVLDEAVARINSSLPNAPSLRAQLQAVLGQAYQNLGQPKTAAGLLEQGAAGLERSGHPIHAASAYARLSILQSREAQYGKAAELADQASRLLQQAHSLAPAPAVQLQIWQAQALALAGLGRQDQAEARLQQILDTHVAASDEASRHEVLEAMRNLGILYRQQGLLLRSQALLERGMAIARTQDGPDSFEYQLSLDAYGMTVYQLGAVERATRLADQELHLTSHLYGPHSHRTIDAETWLAGLDLDLGRYLASSRHFDHALQTIALLDGTLSRDYATTLFGSGVMEEARGDLPEAERRYRQALTIARAVMGPDHPDSLSMEWGLARELTRAGKLAAARPMLDRVIAIQKNRLPPDAPERVYMDLALAEWQIHARQFGEARQILDRLARQHQNPAPVLWLSWMMETARLAQWKGDVRAAARDWGSVVQSFARHYGKDSTATAKWRIIWAQALLADGQQAAARQELQRAQGKLLEVAPNSDFVHIMQDLRKQLATGKPLPVIHSGELPAPAPGLFTPLQKSRHG